MSFWKVAGAIALALFVMSCGLQMTNESGADEEKTTPFRVRIGSDGPTGFRVTLPDGTSYVDPRVYQNEIGSILEELDIDRASVVLVVDPSLSDDFDELPRPVTKSKEETSRSVTGTEQALSGNSPLPYGYHVSFTIERQKWINGCMKTWCTPGSAFRLHRNGAPLWDMHMGAFTRSGRGCVGLYESERTGWTRCTCSPTANDLIRGIRDSLVAAGLAAGTAWLMAQAMAPIVLPVLAL